MWNLHTDWVLMNSLQKEQVGDLSTDTLLTLDAIENNNEDYTWIKKWK